MILLLLRALIYFLSAGIGLIVAGLALEDVKVSAEGFIAATVVFAAVQSIFTPFVAMIAKRHAAALLGGVGIVATLIALAVAERYTDGLTINGAQTWLIASFVVWAATAAATLLLPVFILKRAVANRAEGKSEK